MKLSYQQSGVDIDLADRTKKEIAVCIDNASPNVLNKVGAFASLYDITKLGMKEPVLVLKTEEPGTKQKLAIKYNKIQNICYDMINHLINDIAVMGATPLSVQDAIICGKIDRNIVASMVRYMAQACKDNGCVLTGGETSEQPRVLSEGEYILTSSVVGVVEKSGIIDGSKIEMGDTILAVASNGCHTNGYSFLRMALDAHPEMATTEVGGENFMEAILKPHTAYYNSLKGLYADPSLHGMAHITGGGIEGNLNRILPMGMDAYVNLDAIKVLPLFKYIKFKTGANVKEMLKTFNMGVGLALVVKKGSEEAFINHFRTFFLDCYVVGEVTKGMQRVRFYNDLKL